MQVVFNEISAQNLTQIPEIAAIEKLHLLIKTCQSMRNLTQENDENDFKMRVSNDFWQTKMSETQTILDVLAEDTDNYFLLLDLTSAPYLPNNFDIDELKFLENLEFNGLPLNGDTGMRVAYSFLPKPAFMISFDVNNWQNLDFISLKTTERTIDLYHFTRTKQIYETHFERIVFEYITLKKANPVDVKVDSILPNKFVSNLYLEYFKFYKIIKDENNKNRKTLNTDVSKIKEIGKVVAKINGWKVHKGLSVLNNRIVFIHLQKDSIFITIDTEKGDFEVHNGQKDSNHLGAISFDGAKIEVSKGHKLKFK
jgi:hypothetical protein